MKCDEERVEFKQLTLIESESIWERNLNNFLFIVIQTEMREMYEREMKKNKSQYLGYFNSWT
jgi:hypothetical protein